MKKLFTIVFSMLIMLSFAGCNQNNSGGSADQGENQNESPPVNGEASEASETESDSRDALSVILNSFSTRTFMEKEVNPEDIELILQSGAKAPSARNMQPWHFTVVTNAEMVSKLGGVKGTVFIVVSGLTEEIEGVNPTFDCALATQNMYIAAQSLGLGAHIYAAPIAHINANEKENLNVPEGYDAAALMCIGYIENEADAVSSATPRNPLTDTVNYVDDTMTIIPTPEMQRPPGGPGGSGSPGGAQPSLEEMK